MLVLFFAVMLGVGINCRKHATDVNGFVLGGRSVGPWLTAFAYGTSYFSAVIFIGYAGQFGWKFGIASTWIGLGNAFLGSLLAWRVLGRRTRLMTQHLNSATMPQFFGERYKSNALKIGASIIVFVFLIPYTASLYNGLSRLFAMAILTAIYVIAGGLVATAVNDFIQGIVMLIGIVAVIAAVLSGKGGFMASLSQLAQVSDSSVSDMPGAFASFFGPDPFGLLCVVILTSLGTWGLPQMVQKFYAISNEKAVEKGTIISTIFAIVVAGGCYFLGGFGRIADIEIGAKGIPVGGYDAIIPSMLQNLPDILVGIVVILVLSASMSTLASLVHTSSTTLTLDLIKGHIIKKMDDKKQLLCMRILILVFVAISVVIAIFQFMNNATFIAQLMGISWGALAGAFLAPFIFGLYSKKTSSASVWVSFIFGVGIMVWNLVAKSTLPAVLQSPINCGAFAMIVGLVIVPVVSLFTKAPDAKFVDDAFSCYEETVSVHKSESLGD